MILLQAVLLLSFSVIEVSITAFPCPFSSNSKLFLGLAIWSNEVIKKISHNQE